MARTTTSKAKESFAETLRRVASKRERVIVRRQGKDVAAIVPMEDLAALEELEDRRDLKLARKALADAKKKGEKPIPWTKAKKELGL
ncbi:MAG: prevent-host-death family protein [Acidobacteria bacterium RIFCSPLOWO2_12_FULL_59_11]|nr:MAG: prevent-host-death family protein [Acidobacteria bacterium RIFCSPLOWO2_12_FULL_59_11]